MYNKGGVKIYEVYDYEDMIDLGSGTTWCIAGRERTNGKVKVSQAKYYFNDYIDNLGVSYYIVLYNNQKYCILKQGEDVYTVWSKDNKEISLYSLLEYVPIDDEFLERYFGLQKMLDETFVYDGKVQTPKGVVSVVIENGVTHIGDGAFYNCCYLTDVEIPNSVMSIGIDSFYGCSSLTSITLPNSIQTIDNYAFGDCVNLKSILIPESVEKIHPLAFENCYEIVIQCSSGSVADAYANEHNIKTKYI